MLRLPPSPHDAVFADADDKGLRFILPSDTEARGGLVRHINVGHFSTIVGPGGSGKSILALQIATNLLNVADPRTPTDPPNPDLAPAAAFYFTLEASPEELRRQVEQFRWGVRYDKWWAPSDDTRAERTENFSGPCRIARASGDDLYSNGLYLSSIPSPADSLNTLNLKIRQTIARQLGAIRQLVAIVIDPMGAVGSLQDLRVDLHQIKELAETHRTFVFLLSEKHAFGRHTSIEHYSQSVIHLEHDPGQQQHRRIHIQKARGQSFRSGYHYFELLPEQGVRILPSIEAQSAYAHALTANPPPSSTRPNVQFFADDPEFPTKGGIETGSAVFLMGPPGTFKEQVAARFARAEENSATIHVSFKAFLKDAIPFDSRRELEGPLQAKTYFFDARSPLLTPEEILFAIRNAITNRTYAVDVGEVAFRRAVVWGLRRLYDFPNFQNGRAVQFLEALVTLLKAHRITSLLVDWPDQETRSTVPIVDLCQYIFLSRVCYTTAETPKEIDNFDPTVIRALWQGGPSQVALLRAQRTLEGIHHNQGRILRRFLGRTDIEVHDGNITIDHADRETPQRRDTVGFEQLWRNYGKEWESDLSLQS